MSHRITDFKSLTTFAPFLDDDQVDDLFDRVADKYPDQLDTLKSLAPFVDSENIVDYLRDRLPEIHDAEVRNNTFHAFLPFIDDDDLLGLFDR